MEGLLNRVKLQLKVAHTARDIPLVGAALAAVKA